jgi:hypothetical protein
MKRSICLLTGLAVLAFGHSPASAIDLVSAGIKGGYNIANQSMDPSDSELADSRGGLSLGGYVGIPLTPSLSLQPEALFTMKGDREEADGVEGSFKLNYIEVPVLAKASFMPMSPAKPSIFAGPSVSYNLSAKTEATGVDELDVKDQVNPFDFGLVFGGGLDFPMAGTKSFGVDVRYTMGLTNTIDGDTGAEAKNNVFSIMGTLGFL